MEWLAYLVMGALIGELLMGSRMQNRALGWGALCGLLPLWYLVLWPFVDTASRLWWHRGPTTSLVVIAVASAALARPLAARWSRDKVTPVRAGMFVFAVGCGHAVLACADGVGAAVLWPFLTQRVAFGHVHWGDPLVALPAAVCLVWLAFSRARKPQGRLRPKQRALLQQKHRKLWLWALGMFAGYLMFSAAMKFTAAAGFAADLNRLDAGAARRVVNPEPYSPYAWRAVVDRGEALWVGRRSVFQRPSTPVRWIVYPRGAEDARAFASDREVVRVKASTDDYWIARKHNRGLWMADLRAGVLREFGLREHMVDHRMVRAWNFMPDAPKDRLVPAHAQTAESMDRLSESIQWIMGRDDGADMVPRLAGVPGQFPELMRVVE